LETCRTRGLSIHLIAALEDDDQTIRKNAAIALGKLRDTTALDPLIGLLNDRRFGSLGTAATALGQLGDTRAVEPLLQSLERTDFGVSKAISALAVLGDDRAIEPLVELARNGSRAAARALREFNFQEGGQPLIESLNDTDVDIRKYAAKALGIIGNPEAAEPLIRALYDRHRQVRENAVYALGKLREPRSIQCLREVATSDRSKVVRRAAEDVLQGL